MLRLSGLRSPRIAQHRSHEGLVGVAKRQPGLACPQQGVGGRTACPRPRARPAILPGRQPLTGSRSGPLRRAALRLTAQTEQPSGPEGCPTEASAPTTHQGAISAEVVILHGPSLIAAAAPTTKPTARTGRNHTRADNAGFTMYLSGLGPRELKDGSGPARNFCGLSVAGLSAQDQQLLHQLIRGADDPR